MHMEYQDGHQISLTMLSMTDLVTNQPPLRLESSMSGRNNDAKQGTDILHYSSNVPENNMMGKNDANKQCMLGANINTPTPDSIQGINIYNTVTVKGNNEHLEEALNYHPGMDTHAIELIISQT